MTTFLKRLTWLRNPAIDITFQNIVDQAISQQPKVLCPYSADITGTSAD
jgi:hypothetical protein